MGVHFPYLKSALSFQQSSQPAETLLDLVSASPFKSVEVGVEGCTQEILDAGVKVIYSGSICIDGSNVEAILTVADYLQVCLILIKMQAVKASEGVTTLHTLFLRVRSMPP